MAHRGGCLAPFDSVFNFVSFRVKIRVSPTGRVAAEVSHYDPSFPLQAGWRGDRAFLVVAKIGCIWRVAFKQQFDSWDFCVS